MFPHPSSSSVLAFCRPGMESDCAAELVARCAALEVGAWCRVRDGLVELTVPEAADLATLGAGIRFPTLVFARQWLTIVARPDTLPERDRATPIAAAAAAVLDTCSGVRVEHPDTDAGRPLARLARRLEGPVTIALERAGIAFRPEAPVLHVVLLDGTAAIVGLSAAGNSAPWPMGIPRLKAPRAAPSRSVLKLEEALTLFLSDDERASWLRPGRRAVDLGAAPGGWTWLLAERGLTVDAVDNGRLAASLEENTRVSHHRADGFRFRPRGPVDWLVCDMVEQPHRIAALAAGWLERGDCRHAVVNLKLPMKQRWRTVVRHLETIAAALPPDGRVAAKQLYHDRAEVTVFATR